MEPVWYLQWDLWVGIWTFALSAFTAWVAFETRKMRKGSDQAMSIMAKHAAESAQAAIVSAAATKALVEIGQRPWLSIRSIQLTRELTTEEPAVSLSVRFTNSGATPAQDVRTNHYSLVAQADFPDDPPYPMATGSKQVSFTLAAKETRTLFVELPLDSLGLQRTIAEEGTLYVYGTASYRDAFGNTHRTTWCSRYAGGVGDDSIFTVEPKHESIE